MLILGLIPPARFRQREQIHSGSQSKAITHRPLGEREGDWQGPESKNEAWSRGMTVALSRDSLDKLWAGSEAPLGGREVLCLGVHCRAPSWPMSQVSFSLLRKTGLQSGCLYKPLSAWVPETALAPGVSMPGVVTAPHVHKQKIMALLLSGSLNSIHLIYKCSLHLTHWYCAIC